MQQRFPLVSLAALRSIKWRLSRTVFEFGYDHVTPQQFVRTAAYQPENSSQYMRRPLDLPLSGRRVELRIMVRRFWCDAVLCGRSPANSSKGRASSLRPPDSPLETIVHHLGLALGGRPGAAFAHRLIMLLSNDKLLRETIAGTNVGPSFTATASSCRRHV